MLKRFFIVGCGIAALLVLATHSHAQENKEFNLKVNGADITIIGEALGELSYKKASGLMTKLQLQLNQQMQLPVPTSGPEIKPEQKEEKKE